MATQQQSPKTQPENGAGTATLAAGDNYAARFGSLDMAVVNGGRFRLEGNTGYHLTVHRISERAKVSKLGLVTDVFVRRTYELAREDGKDPLKVEVVISSQTPREPTDAELPEVVRTLNSAGISIPPDIAARAAGLNRQASPAAVSAPGLRPVR